MIKIRIASSFSPIKKESISRSKQGKKNRASGARFELKTRKDLEKDGWIIDKWTNNVDLQFGKLGVCNIWDKIKKPPRNTVLGGHAGLP